jgi:spore germination cell wall hydrolase CwlJ-like protein
MQLNKFYLVIAAVLATPQIQASDVVVATLILEAGGEYAEGSMEAVYEVIVNRAINRRKTIEQICLQPKQFSCWNNVSVERGVEIAKRHRRWREAQAIVYGPVTNYTSGADHYHAKRVNPYWKNSMTVTATIGNHIFYKSK